MFEPRYGRHQSARRCRLMLLVVVTYAYAVRYWQH